MRGVVGHRAALCLRSVWVCFLMLVGVWSNYLHPLVLSCKPRGFVYPGIGSISCGLAPLSSFLVAFWIHLSYSHRISGAGTWSILSILPIILSFGWAILGWSARPCLFFLVECCCPTECRLGLWCLLVWAPLGKFCICWSIECGCSPCCLLRCPLWKRILFSESEGAICLWIPVLCLLSLRTL